MIRSEIRKMFHLKWFKLSVLVMLLLSVMFVVMQKTAMDYEVSIDRVLFLPLTMYGIAAAALISMTTGSEYEGGFIRNKVFAGHSRRQIYLAGAVSSLAGGIALYLITVLFTALISVGRFEHTVTALEFMQSFGLGLCTCLAYLSIYYAVSMVIGQKAAAGVACTLLAFVMLFMSLYANSYVNDPTLTNSFWELLYDANPTGQVAQVSAMRYLAPFRFVMYDMAWILIAGGLGMWLFERKELK